MLACPDRRIWNALSSNLRRSKVRAAGSCSRFNTSGVRTARPMHYEGAPVPRASREIPTAVEKREVLRSKAYESFFRGIFKRAGKRLESLTRD